MTGQVVRFVYDGEGNRILRIDPERTTVYIGDYYEQAGSTVHKYYYAGGRRIAVRVNGALYFLHSDHLGSATLTTDAGGNRVGEARYKPYGEARYIWGVMPTDRLYTGQRWDSGLGLYDYRARYYHPVLGRFVSADTLVQANAKNPAPYLPLAVSYADPKVLEQWNQLQQARLQPGAQTPSTPSAFDPQFLNRYSYGRNNPLAYVDDSGHIAWWVGWWASGPMPSPIGTTSIGSRRRCGRRVGRWLGPPLGQVPSGWLERWGRKQRLRLARPASPP